jgi:hypothetical protein
MSRLTLRSTYKLASGFQIPVVGFGVSKTPFLKSPAPHDDCCLNSHLLVLMENVGLPNVRALLSLILKAYILTVE